MHRCGTLLGLVVGFSATSCFQPQDQTTVSTATESTTTGDPATSDTTPMTADESTTTSPSTTTDQPTTTDEPTTAGCTPGVFGASLFGEACFE